MTTHSIKLLIGTLLLASTGYTSLSAGESDRTNDHSPSRRFPADQVVNATPDTRTFKVKLATLANSIEDSLGGCTVEVIDPKQKRQRLTADKNGIATIQDAQEGLYVIVAANEVAYGTIVIACREMEDVVETDADDDIFRLDFEETEPNDSIILMMIPVSEGEIRPVVTNNFPEFPSILPTVVDRSLVTKQLTTPGAENMIQLGKGGALRGKLTSVVLPVSRYSGVEGTLVVVYKDGKPVGKTTANGLGQFQINGLKPGVHGLVVAGRGGFAAFGIKMVDNEGLINRPLHGRGFSYAQLMNDGEILPVVLAPPTVFPQITDAVASIYEDIRLQQGEANMMLAQKSALDKEDQLALEAVRNTYANQNEPKVAARPTETKRSRSRIVTESLPETAALELAQPSTPELKMKVAERNDIPVNPLRLSASHDSSIPFNPLRAN